MRPRIALRPLIRRLRHKLEVDDTSRTMAHRGADAIVAGVSATDDNDALALGLDRGRRRRVGLRVPPPLPPTLANVAAVEQSFGVPVEELHGEVNALRVTTGCSLQVAGKCRPRRKQDRVVLVQQILRRRSHVDAGGGVVRSSNAPRLAGDEFHSLLGHNVDPPLHHVDLVGLHVRHPIHHQPSDAVCSFVDGDPVAHFVQLVRRGQARGPRTNNGDPFSSAERGRRRLHPAHFVSLVDDAELNGLDADGVIDDAQDASTLARCGANASGELREIVRLHKPLEGLVPLPCADEVVPLGNEVSERTTGPVGHALVAKRGPAVHAPRRLRLDLLWVLVVEDFPEVRDALMHFPFGQVCAVVIQEAPILLFLQDANVSLLGPETLCNDADVFDVWPEQFLHVAEAPLHVGNVNTALAAPGLLQRRGFGVRPGRRQDFAERGQNRRLAIFLRLGDSVHEL
mmetsp:Transcript_111573/g.315060  ORF Transcript_111573/g.315060 Transcript_111573/m.315060 type:complete len:456 (-) Transcript_111573:4835-6202(-)